jgi:hypothetical protein
MKFEAKQKIVAQSRANIGKVIPPNRHPTYELVNSKAESFWSSTAASMFDINLKSEFVPLNLMKTFDRNHTS